MKIKTMNETVQFSQIENANLFWCDSTLYIKIYNPEGFDIGALNAIDLESGRPIVIDSDEQVHPEDKMVLTYP